MLRLAETYGTPLRATYFRDLVKKIQLGGPLGLMIEISMIGIAQQLRAGHRADYQTLISDVFVP